MTLDAFWLGRGAALCLVASLVALGLHLLTDRSARARRSLAGRVARLDSRLGYLRATTRGKTIVMFQAAALGAASAGALASTATWLLALPVVSLLPSMVIERRCALRTRRIEEQIESWLSAIASSLEASASIGEAIASSVTLLPAPIGDEVRLVIDECALGAPLDVALTDMVARIPSKTLASTVLALKIARRSGGSLPETLQNAAATLREMARLEGVVRTKTAEGKAQAFVIAAIPFPLVLLVHGMDPRFFEPLVTSFAGQVVVGCAGVLWVLAVFFARKILDVDI